MKMVSIVIPCYNVEKYITDCLDSLCRQTYKNLEIICVDDGSTDDTRDIILKYCEKDSRICLIQQTNQYAGIARNNGLKKANGEYVCFLDSDDFFDTSMIEEMMCVAQQYDTDIVLCNAQFYNDVTKEITEPSHILNMNYLNKINKVFSYKDIPERILTVGGSVPWNKLYRTDFLREKQLYFQGIKRCNDEYFVGMSMALADKISYVNKRLVTYRINNNNSLQGYADEATSYDFYKALYALREGLIEKGVFGEIENNYVNKALQGCNVALERQKNAKNFIELYNFIKMVAFDGLGIGDTPKEKIYAESDLYESIKNYDAVDYLFYSLKKIQKSKGEQYLFPYELIGNSKKIIIYAMGEVGSAYYRQLVNNNYYQLVACFDSNYERFQQKEIQIMNPEKINEFEFDIIVVAIKDERLYKEIERCLIDYGIEPEKIVWGCR